MKRTTISTSVLLPPELRKWLEAEAAKQTRSVSQQVVHMLNQQRAVEQAKQPETEAA